jgi:hypothetical protein
MTNPETQAELLDYETEDNTLANGDIAIDEDDVAAATLAEPEVPSERKIVFAGHASLHSTGFQDMMLKPELTRAIAEAGFEHPSGEKSARTSAWWPSVDCLDCLDCLDWFDWIDWFDCLDCLDCLDWFDWIDCLDCLDWFNWVDWVDWVDCLDCLDCLDRFDCLDWID